MGLVNPYHCKPLCRGKRDILNKYPNKYLEESTFINGGQDETLA